VLAAPDPPLADDLIRLEPLRRRHVGALLPLADDDAVRRFTHIPDDASEAFVRRWIVRYERGWRSGERAGFAIHELRGAVVGFAALVKLDLAAREGEIGYFVGAGARGRGVARRSVELLTRWGFETLDLVRIELLIDVANEASGRVAERAGYRREGILRSRHFKNGLRTDCGIWSRLRDDGPIS
jgi:RimJ/RimL family protein N-acetyltransferase